MAHLNDRRYCCVASATHNIAVPDSFIHSETSCSISQVSPSPGRMDVAVCNGFNPTRVFLKQMSTNSTARVIVLETDITHPAQPTAANTDYSIWSINVNGTDRRSWYCILLPKIAGRNTHFAEGACFVHSVGQGHTDLEILNYEPEEV
ncbi:hypothetical protein B0H14DRAFT_2635281 [Mycena olivaceomarginata]|nr:hypothetical protein B0H14DRAFT_2635281 [Mycena olivaceomarginata]